MEAADVEDAVLVGFSMGGGEVARYLSRHEKTRVAQVGLISSVVPFMLQTADNPGGAPAKVFEDMKAGIREDRAGFMRGFAPQFFGNGWIKKAVSDGVLDSFFQMAILAGLWPTLACVDAFSSTDFRGDMAAFDLPTLIIHGTDDRTVPIDISARKAAAAIPHAQLIEYEGAAHGVLATNTADVTRDLLAFIGEA
jgi:pimeloyl-ACP methyl ester carboxylesterase